MVLFLTLFFVFATAVYAGITAAVTFKTSHRFAFAFVLGQFFVWALWTAFICWGITRSGLRKEREWWHATRQGEGVSIAIHEKRPEVPPPEVPQGERPTEIDRPHEEKEEAKVSNAAENGNPENQAS